MPVGHAHAFVRGKVQSEAVLCAAYGKANADTATAVAVGALLHSSVLGGQQVDVAIGFQVNVAPGINAAAHYVEYAVFTCAFGGDVDVTSRRQAAGHYVLTRLAAVAMTFAVTQADADLEAEAFIQHLLRGVIGLLAAHCCVGGGQALHPWIGGFPCRLYGLLNAARGIEQRDIDTAANRGTAGTCRVIGIQHVEASLDINVLGGNRDIAFRGDDLAGNLIVMLAGGQAYVATQGGDLASSLSGADVLFTVLELGNAQRVLPPGTDLTGF